MQAEPHDPQQVTFIRANVLSSSHAPPTSSDDGVYSQSEILWGVLSTFQQDSARCKYRNTVREPDLDLALRPVGQHAHLILPFSCLDSQLGPHLQPRPTVCCQRPLHRCRRGAPGFCRPTTGCIFEGGTSSSSARAFPRILDAAQNIMRQRGRLSLRKYMAQLQLHRYRQVPCLPWPNRSQVLRSGGQ